MLKVILTLTCPAGFSLSKACVLRLAGRADLVSCAALIGCALFFVRACPAILVGQLFFCEFAGYVAAHTVCTWGSMPGLARTFVRGRKTWEPEEVIMLRQKSKKTPPP